MYLSSNTDVIRWTSETDAARFCLDIVNSTLLWNSYVGAGNIAESINTLMESARDQQFQNK